MGGETAVETDLLGFRQMLDSITDYEVIRLDPDGRVRSWHPGAERLTGYQAEEIIGRPVTVFYTEEDVRSGTAEREMAAAVREGRMETAATWEELPGRPLFAALVAAVADCLGRSAADPESTRTAQMLWHLTHGMVSQRIARPFLPWPPIQDIVEDAVARLVTPARVPA